jgi:MFS family permease
MRSAAVNKKWVVFAVGLGLFMAMLDATIVNISIPTMMKDFNITYSSIAWVLDAYMLTLAVLVLVMGRLADQFGRRLLYGIGICIFAVGSLLCAVSSGVGFLIGITAAAVGPTLGGVFVQYLSWHWIVYINIPIGILALVLTRFKSCPSIVTRMPRGRWITSA